MSTNLFGRRSESTRINSTKAIWGGLLFSSLALSPAQAAWDLRHAAGVEDLLIDYIRTLPEGQTIKPPRLFFFEGRAYSRGCPNVGIDAPAYCPADHTVYLELGLGNQVAERYGDFGALSIIAHEFGHAYMFKRNQHPVGNAGELAADAFAGGFARYAETRGALEPGDLDEARYTFASVGDYEVYHHDHHGTPMERRQAFEDGYLQGFRLPGDSSPPVRAPLEKPAPTPSAPATPSQQPLPPQANPIERSPSSVMPLLLGAVFLLAMVGGVAALVIHARRDEW